MKKLVVVLAVAFSGVLNAQCDKETLVLNIFEELKQEQEIRLAMSGYKPDPNFKFQSILKKVATGQLNIDSLSNKQPHLERVSVNEYWEEHTQIKLLDYLDQLSLEQFNDTSIYVIEYRQSIQYFGNISEYLSITNKLTNIKVVSLTLNYELHSNLIHNAIADLL